MVLLPPLVAPVRRRSCRSEIFASFVDDPVYVAVDLRPVAQKIAELLIALGLGA